jgi:hypothetical protein
MPLNFLQFSMLFFTVAIFGCSGGTFASNMRNASSKSGNASEYCFVLE